MALIVVMYWKQILKIVLTLNIPFLQKFIPYLEANEASNRTFYVKIFMLIVIILGMKCLKVYMCVYFSYFMERHFNTILQRIMLLMMDMKY